jgi:hypothetical protein
MNVGDKQSIIYRHIPRQQKGLAKDKMKWQI